MPELPEVETMVREVRPALLGRTIAEVRLTHSDVLRGITARRLLSSLRGARVLEVSRRAKHAVVRLGGHRLIVQPGMTGSLQTHDAPLDADQSRYAVLRATLDDGRLLVYRDIRRIGTLRLLDDRAWQAYSDRLGPEPLDPAFTSSELRQALNGTRQAVKKALMDQRLVVGVGNIYANEALFAAGIDPSRPGSSIDADEADRLHRHVVRILQAAIDADGTTIRDYQTGTGQPGNFQLELFVYGREGEPCRRCGTLLAGTHSIDARITVFCWRCQGGQAGRRAGGQKQLEDPRAERRR
ncbi:MAG TPA: bifunctional DNA-formamidopyrimidine glycosylase/DNA-(apurinic or apyrimidinic site) lyase [Gemmatimonadales bacterium]|nr:bifunctional DNA-formamidopyrimidine glycosylase/DNA-(apurinic or apyrimidinic site) lyase [Gemmatimonadales bacterium]